MWLLLSLYLMPVTLVAFLRKFFGIRSLYLNLLFVRPFHVLCLNSWTRWVCMLLCATNKVTPFFQPTHMLVTCSIGLDQNYPATIVQLSIEYSLNGLLRHSSAPPLLSWHILARCAVPNSKKWVCVCICISAWCSNAVDPNIEFLSLHLLNNSLNMITMFREKISLLCESLWVF